MLRRITYRLYGHVRRLAAVVRRRRSGHVPFDKAARPDVYWDLRYRLGGTSGKGSIGATRQWKWAQIDGCVDVLNRSVLDIGCGDLSFWRGRACEDYTGLDFSDTVVKRNRRARRSWTFIQGDASQSQDLSGEIVLCLDMLFHVMSDDVYEAILRNLARWTQDWLFIYTWRRSPLGDQTSDGKYQSYRPLLDSASLLQPLMHVKTHAYSDYGALYVFRR